MIFEHCIGGNKVTNKPEVTKDEAEERLKQLFLETQLGIELDEVLRQLVPPDNPFWGGLEEEERPEE